MSEWDEDGDGSINFAEFLSAMTRILTDTDSEERMKEAFQLFDKVRTFSFQSRSLYFSLESCLTVLLSSD